ncbi:hypothetical protein ACFL0M_11795 [Thermodesulfobacteriota bacterium]
MTKKIINRVQDYLTVVQPDGDRVYQIVNIECLLQRHPPGAVVSFLNELRNDCKKSLKLLLKNNISDSRVNDFVAKNFRLKMAIKTIQNYEREVKAA